jgi:hypothetical protein
MTISELIKSLRNDGLSDEDTMVAMEVLLDQQDVIVTPSLRASISKYLKASRIAEVVL